MAEKSRNVTGYRLLFGFSSIILLLITFGVIFLIEIRALSKVTRTIYNHPLVVSNASLSATVSVTKMHRSMKDVALFDFPSEIKPALSAVSEQEHLVYENLNTVKKNILGNEGQKLENETRKIFINWKPIRAEVIKLVREGQREEAARITMEKGANHVVKLENKMLELTSYARNKASDFIQQGEMVRSRVEKITIILISIGISLSVFIAFLTIRRTYKAEEKVIERTEQLKITNDELSQYTRAVSHDLKTPLRAIHNYVDFLREDLEGTLDGDQKQYLDGLGHAAVEADTLVGDLLAYSRIDSSSILVETIDMGAFLRQVIDAFSLPPDIDIVIMENWPAIDTESVIIRQIFQNLIDNAIKFNNSSRKRIEIGWRPLGHQHYEFFVRDNGIGIEPRYHEQIFRVFERLHTKEGYEGTGIGLAIVDKAARKMGGGVRVESKPGEGSTFFVTLPISQKEE